MKKIKKPKVKKKKKKKLTKKQLKKKKIQDAKDVVKSHYRSKGVRVKAFKRKKQTKKKPKPKPKDFGTILMKTKGGKYILKRIFRSDTT